jgi:hypothetical protein
VWHGNRTNDDDDDDHGNQISDSECMNFDGSDRSSRTHAHAHTHTRRSEDIRQAIISSTVWHSKRTNDDDEFLRWDDDRSQLITAHE